jgi:hypothetical protein
MKKADTVTVGIRFKEFKFLRFGFVEKDNISEEDLGVQLTVDFNDSGSVKEGQSKIIVKVIVVITTSTEEIVANVEAASVFGLDGIPPDKVHDNGVVKYPESLMTTLVSLAISTTRGAILAKGAGSFLEKMPLPIVDPKEFVDNMKSQKETNATK